MTRAVFCILLLSLAFQLQAQKFKEIYPVLIKSSDEESLSILKSYMKDDLDHPNSNFRLALIYERRYRAYNPITEYERALANAREANLRFVKSMGVVNEKEVNKNTGYYSDFASGFDSKGRAIVNFSTINNKIQNGYDSSKLFYDKIPVIYNYFTKSVNFHDNAIKAFNEINGNFGSRDKLLLMYNDELKTKLERLISDYDSSIVNLDKYLNTSKSFDPIRFNQTYTVKEIETYRLQGLLTSPNFLIKNIEIWNYKTWAQRTIKEVSGDITNLRNDLNRIEIELSKVLKPMSPLVATSDFKPYLIDNKFVFNLIKYDNQSLPLATLKYKQYKQYLIHQLGIINDRDTTNTTNIYLNHLGELIYRAKNADSLLQIVERRTEKENIEKYSSFFKANYNGEAGLKQFVKTEQKIASDATNQGVSEMLATIKKDNNSIKPSFLTYRNLKLSNQPESVNIDSLDNAPHTLFSTTNTDGSLYLAGVIKSGKKPNHVNVFIAKADEKNKVIWYKEMSFTEDNATQAINEVGSMVLTPEGCGVLVHSKNSEGVKNKLYYIDENGTEIFSKEIENTLYPREMLYIETSNSFVYAHRGTSKKQNFKEKEVTELMSINILGDILWTQSFEYTGNLISLLNLEKGFMIVGNYAELKDTEGKVYRTKINTGQTNAFAARFTNSGKLSSVQTIESPNNYMIDKIVKVNDKIINLLGNNGTFEMMGDLPIHIIINSGPSIIHSDLKN